VAGDAEDEELAGDDSDDDEDAATRSMCG